MPDSTIKLLVPPGYNFRAVLQSHGWRQLAPFHWDEATPDELRYTFALHGGRVTTLVVGLTPDDDLATTSSLSLTRPDVCVVRDALRAMLALDLDLTPFYNIIADEPRYAWVRPAGAGRLLAAPTAWEDLVKTLFTTNVSWTNTINMTRRFCDYGPQGVDGRHAFPSPADVLAHDADVLNAHVRCGYRITSLYKLAEGIVNGSVDVEGWRTSETDSAVLYKRLTGLHGFGAYAAGAVMRLWGHQDQLALDSVARAAFADRFHDGEKQPDSVIETFYAGYGAWRGLALWMDVIGPI
ncbi:MAG: 3-methyladenine DNA glycosylase [Chloroflexota bacterium]